MDQGFTISFMMNSSCQIRKRPARTATSRAGRSLTTTLSDQRHALVDVLVLLIIFMVTAPMMQQGIR